VSPGGEAQSRARRSELRRRRLRRRRATGAALLVAVAGIGIWAAGTLASGGSGSRHGAPSSDSLLTVSGADSTGVPAEASTAATPSTTTTTTPAAVPSRSTRRVTIAWVGDTVLASKYGTPPAAGRR
jgi:hypothetical protein